MGSKRPRGDRHAAEVVEHRAGVSADPRGVRIRLLTRHAAKRERAFVLYWMTSARRVSRNFGLEHAVERARALQRPLVVLEALRSDYAWASDRLHTFVIEGMADNAVALARNPVTYYPYIESVPGAGKGLLRALAAHACVVVTDDFPAFFLPRMLAAASRQVDVSFEAVDSNGLIPLRATDHARSTAFAFRRFVHAYLAKEGVPMPAEDPFGGGSLPVLDALPAAITRRWHPANGLDDPASLVRRIAIDHTVGPVEMRGGSRAAEVRLRRFLDRGLDVYERDRNDPDADGTSGLSPYLHFGHIAAHEVVARVIASGAWTPEAIEVGARGSRAGWGGPAGVGAFLDQIITWRELGYNLCAHQTDYDRYESLPEWARGTLADHEEDPREWCYSLDEFAASATHDEVWNAAQRQLRTTGVLHNYLRMLWGKKILEWTCSPREALAVMVELNNRFALDGRDPNSWSGIFWTLGRYDRAWGPERPVFGKIRFMSSANTRRKLKLTRYLVRFGADGVAR